MNTTARPSKPEAGAAVAAAKPKTGQTPGVVGGNTAGNLTGLTALFPIKTETMISGGGVLPDHSAESALRAQLAQLPCDETSPFAQVPNTYFVRFYILKDVFDQGPQESITKRLIRNLLPGHARPVREPDHLQSPYLVMAADFHGPLDAFLSGWWANAQDTATGLFSSCVGFGAVTDTATFASYVTKCRVKNSLLFQGSTDQPLADQLKGLHVKQHFADFVIAAQSLTDAERLTAFNAFMKEHTVASAGVPTWRPGAELLQTIERTVARP